MVGIFSFIDLHKKSLKEKHIHNFSFNINPNQPFLLIPKRAYFVCIKSRETKRSNYCLHNPAFNNRAEVPDKLCQDQPRELLNSTRVLHRPEATSRRKKKTNRHHGSWATTAPPPTPQPPAAATAAATSAAATTTSPTISPTTSPATSPTTTTSAA